MKTIPASVYFHRAYLSLIPAMTLSVLSYRGFAWYLLVASGIAWAFSVYWLWHGSRQLRHEQLAKFKA